MKTLIVPHTCGEVHMIDVDEEDVDFWIKRTNHIYQIVRRDERQRCGSCWERGEADELVLVGKTDVGLMIVHKEECLDEVYAEDWRVVGVILEPPFPEVDDDEEAEVDDE